jgi:hypothetical protein
MALGGRAAAPPPSCHRAGGDETAKPAGAQLPGTHGPLDRGRPGGAALERLPDGLFNPVELL